MILDPAGLVDEVRVKDLRLSKSTEQLLPVVAAMPLASVVDYAAVVGKTPSYFYPRLWELRDAGTAQLGECWRDKAEGRTVVSDPGGNEPAVYPVAALA